MVADICETTFQKKSRCEISDYNTDSEVKLGRVKRHIFDSLGWMPMAELYEGGANIQTERCTFARLALNLRLHKKPEKCFFLWKPLIFKKHPILKRKISF